MDAFNCEPVAMFLEGTCSHVRGEKVDFTIQFSVQHFEHGMTKKETHQEFQLPSTVKNLCRRSGGGEDEDLEYDGNDYGDNDNDLQQMDVRKRALLELLA